MSLLTKGDKISEGAYGVVYNINDTCVMKRNLVKKLILGIVSLKEYDINMLLRENENICKLLRVSYGNPIKGTFSPRSTDNILKDDTLYFFFEKCDMNLEEWCMKSYDIKKVYNILLKLSLALEYIHNKGVIHRDIKPKNILVKGDEIKIIDFGISTYYTKRENSDFNICAIDYRAPEIIFKEEYDQSIDIWSLGCVFLELVNKEYLFDHDDEKNSIAKSANIINKKFHNLLPDDKLEALDIKRITTPDTLINISPEEFNNNIGSYDDFMSLIRNIFIYNGRFNITEVLNHKFFSKSRTDIYNYRYKYRDSNKDIIVFKRDCPERKILNDFITMCLCNKSRKWFMYRTIFQMIDIFDRLSFSEPELKDIEVLLESIYYICIKMFVPEAHIPSVKFILNQNVKAVIKKEEYVIDRLIETSDNIYRRTVFEESEIYTIDVEELLNFYIKVNYSATPLQYLSDFLHV